MAHGEPGNGTPWARSTEHHERALRPLHLHSATWQPRCDPAHSPAAPWFLSCRCRWHSAMARRSHSSRSSWGGAGGPSSAWLVRIRSCAASRASSRCLNSWVEHRLQASLSRAALGPSAAACRSSKVCSVGRWRFTSTPASSTVAIQGRQLVYLWWAAACMSRRGDWVRLSPQVAATRPSTVVQLRLRKCHVSPTPYPV